MHPARKTGLAVGGVLEAVGLWLVAFEDVLPIGVLLLLLGAFAVLIAAGGRPWRVLFDAWF